MENINQVKNQKISKRRLQNFSESILSMSIMVQSLILHIESGTITSQELVKIYETLLYQTALHRKTLYSLLSHTNKTLLMYSKLDNTSKNT